jgi:hypothetical protein
MRTACWCHLRFCNNTSLTSNENCKCFFEWESSTIKIKVPDLASYLGSGRRQFACCIYDCVSEFRRLRGRRLSRPLKKTFQLMAAGSRTVPRMLMLVMIPTMVSAVMPGAGEYCTSYSWSSYWFYCDSDCITHSSTSQCQCCTSVATCQQGTYKSSGT